jgi:hypothetical protein
VRCFAFDFATGKPGFWDFYAQIAPSRKRKEENTREDIEERQREWNRSNGLVIVVNSTLGVHV